MDIDILLWFQSIRNGALDIIFSAFSFLGTDVFAFFVFAAVYWCIDKRSGRLLAFNLFIVNTLNAVLSTYVIVGGPWIKDNRLSPTFMFDNSDQQAFSFACIKALNAGASLGTVALYNAKKLSFRIGFIVCIFLIGISQLYFGVEAFQDVFIAFGISLLVIIITNFIALFSDLNKDSDVVIATATAVMALAAIVIVCSNVYDTSYVGSANGVAPHIINSLCHLSSLIIFSICYIIERRKVNFSVKASKSVQITKLLVGTAVIFTFMLTLKTPLDTAFTALTHNASLGLIYSGVIRYCFTIAFITVIYPMIFSAVLKSHQKSLPKTGASYTGEAFLPTSIKHFFKPVRQKEESLPKAHKEVVERADQLIESIHSEKK